MSNGLFPKTLKEYNYIICQGDSPSGLCVEVQRMRMDGFKPVGGMCVTTVVFRNERKGYDEISSTYYQAMERAI